jgi:hypothetical protein
MQNLYSHQAVLYFAVSVTLTLLSASLWELHMLKCHNIFAKTASIQDKSLVITSIMKDAKIFTGQKSLYISSY